MPFGAIIGGLLGLGGAALNASSASYAANAAAQAQIAGQQQALAVNQPYLNTGGNALGALQNYVGVGQGGSFNPNAPGVAPFTAQQFQQSPGYQWQMQQGTNAIMNNASAMGGVNSGNTLKALQTYGQGLANQDYYNAANLYTNQQQNTLGALQSLTGVGQTAAGAASGVAIQGGNTRAANAVAQGQISSNLVNGLTIGSGSNSLQSLYSSLFGNNGSGYVGSPTGAGNNGVPY